MAGYHSGPVMPSAVDGALLAWMDWISKGSNLSLRHCAELNVLNGLMDTDNQAFSVTAIASDDKKVLTMQYKFNLMAWFSSVV